MAILSLYTLAIESRRKSPDDFFAAITEVTGELFGELLDYEKYTASEKQSILLYIIYAYSQDSDYLIHGRNSSADKLKIAEMVSLPEYAIKAVCGLEDGLIRDIVINYLEYQSDRDFQHYMMKRKLYDDMLGMTAKGMTKEDGKTDFKAIVDAAKYMDDLLDNIKAYEKQMRGEWAFKEENEADIKSIQQSFKKPAPSLSIEHNPEINKK